MFRFFFGCIEGQKGKNCQIFHNWLRDFFRFSRTCDLSSVYVIDSAQLNGCKGPSLVRIRSMTSGNCSEVDSGSGRVVSRFFGPRVVKNEENKGQIWVPGQPIDGKSVAEVREVGSCEYFERMDRVTNDDPGVWATPLSPDTLLSLQGNALVPDNFLPIFSRVRTMRAALETPVDTMGCPRIPFLVSERFGISREKLRPQDYRLQLLVSLILASQTKDETVTKAMYEIMKYCVGVLKDKRGTTLHSLQRIPRETLERLIKPCGFYKRKALYIERTAERIHSQFNDDVPTTIADMESLMGVGPKIGYLALQKSWGIVDGICVDVHVHRLCNMWKWTGDIPCNTAEETRVQVEKWLPRELWYDFNTILVGFGQIMCGPRTKRCDLCLANKVCNASRLKEPHLSW